jgi:uncharacterized protein YndB with AHSA1/START domain
MTQRSITHAMFSLERTYDASPSRVFHAFADPTIKLQWFSGPEEWGPAEAEMDFRVGGRETNRGGPKGGPVSSFVATYQDIVPDERIVYTYEMELDGTRVSVSVASIQLTPEGSGTRLTITEQGAFLDGHEDPALREEGTGWILDALARALEREASPV